MYDTELGQLFRFFAFLTALLFGKIFNCFFCVFVYTDDLKNSFRVAGIKFCNMSSFVGFSYFFLRTKSLSFPTSKYLLIEKPIFLRIFSTSESPRYFEFLLETSGDFAALFCFAGSVGLTHCVYKIQRLLVLLRLCLQFFHDKLHCIFFAILYHVAYLKIISLFKRYHFLCFIPHLLGSVLLPSFCNALTIFSILLLVSCLVILHSPTEWLGSYYHFFSTCPRLFSQCYNIQFHCIRQRNRKHFVINF